MRGIVDAMRDGVPLERMAVVIGNNEPYARLLHDHLELAGSRTTACRCAPSPTPCSAAALLRLLALPDHDFRRDDVFALLAGAPVLDGRGRAVPAVAWERISRDAGVVGGRRRSGRARLDALRRRRSSHPTTTRRLGRARAPARARELRRFVAELAPISRARARARGRSSRAGRTSSSRGGSAPRRARAEWSAFEQEAARRVDAAVDRLGGLDAVEAAPTLDVFRRSLALELDAARDRVGRLGEGVLVGLGRRSRSASSSTGSGCAGWPKACSRRRPPTIRCSPTPIGRRSAASCRCAPTASATISARCSPRSRRRPAHARCASPAATCGATPSTSRRGSCSTRSRCSRDAGARRRRRARAVVHARAVVRARRRARAVPGDAPRARRARRARGRAADRARSPRSRAGASSRSARRSADVHALRRQPRAPRRRAARGAQPARAPTSRCRRPGSRRGRSARTRTSCGTCCTSQPIERPEEIIQLSPLDKGNIVHDTLDAVPRRAARRRTGRPALVRRAARAPPRDPATRRATRSRRVASAAAGCCGRAARRELLAAARRVPRRRRRVPRRHTAPTRSRPSSRSAARRRARRGRDHAAPTAASVRVSGSIDRVDRAPTAGSSSSTTRPAGPTATRRVSHDDPLLGGTHAAAPDLRPRARATFLGDGRRRRSQAYYWFVLREPNKPRRLRRRRRRRGGARRRGARRSSTASRPACFPARAAGARLRAVHRVRVLRPRRPRHHRPYREWVRKRAAPELAGYRRAHRATTSERPARAARPGDSPRARRSAPRLDETLFVEAGAGTGKTTVLVDRIVALVTADGPGLPVPMRAIAAITFTEKAAAELRDRVRRELEQRRAATSSRRRARTVSSALDELDDAAICTLHAFAQRILTEFPIEAGLAAAHRGARRDLVAASRSRTRWRAPRRRAARRSRARAGDAGPARGRRAARPPARGRRGPRRQLGPARPHRRRRRRCPPLDARRVARRARRGVRARGRVPRRRRQAARPARRARRVRATGSAPRVDDVERVELLLRRQAVVPGADVGQQGQLARHRRRCATGSCELGEQRDAIVGACHRRRVCAASPRSSPRCTADATPTSGARAGELEFHDLLVLARALLRDPAHGAACPRRGCATATSACSIDEFQDTDPIQVELAALLGSGDPTPTATRPWTRDRGRRPAGCSSSATPSSRSTGSGGPTSRRSSPARDHFADRAAAAHVQLPLDRAGARVDQPRVRPSSSSRAAGVAARVPRARRRRGPTRRRARACVLLGVDPHDDGPDADDAARARGGRRRRRGARARSTSAGRSTTRNDGVARRAPRRHLHPAAGAHVARLPRAGARRRGHPVPRRDQLARLRHAARCATCSTTLRGDRRSERRARARHRAAVVAVRLRRRRPVRVPRRARRPVGRPRAAARVAARRPSGRRGDAVPRARCTRQPYVGRRRASCSSGSCASATCSRSASLGGRFRDVARRVRFVVDQARAFGDAAAARCATTSRGPTLQGTEGARVVETVLPETDDDAVRIMTIHGAKGLEFPIVVCSGTTTAAPGAAARRAGAVPAGGRLRGAAARRACRPTHFELHQPIDEQMGFHEKLRLLYVACTRARDHLVVSVHRKDRDARPTTSRRWTHAELLWDAADGRARGRRTTPRRDAAGARRRRALVAAPAARARRRGTRSTTPRSRRGRRRAFVVGDRRSPRRVDAAAAGDPGLAKDGRDLELPPWNKGRYGTAIGRAVHAVLQTVDLATGAGLDETAAAQAAAEGVLGHEATIAALARAALESDDRAAPRARRAFWRETYVAVPLDGHHARGLRRPRVPRRRRPRRRRLQDRRGRRRRRARRAGSRTTACRRAAYALAVAAATGEPRRPLRVRASSHPDGAREVVVEGADLAAAIAEVARARRRRARRPARRSPRRARRRLTSARADPPDPDRAGPVCHPGWTREGLPVPRRASSLIVALGGAALAGSVALLVPGGPLARDAATPLGDARPDDQRAGRSARSCTTASASVMTIALRARTARRSSSKDVPQVLDRRGALDRGPQVLRAQRRRLRRAPSRALFKNVDAGEHRAGRLDDHPAAREEHAVDEPRSAT